MDSLAWIPDPEIRALAVTAARNGWMVERTKGGHVRFQGPDVSYYGPTTPSDWRSVRNLKAKLARAGIDSQLDEADSPVVERPAIDKLVVNRTQPRRLRSTVYKALNSEPVTAAVLTTRLRLDGHAVFEAEVGQALDELVERGRAGHTKLGFSRHVLPEPTMPTGTVLLRGVWHRVAGERTVCGYLLRPGLPSATWFLTCPLCGAKRS